MDRFSLVLSLERERERGREKVARPPVAAKAEEKGKEV
jgi:hypothetical protein